MTKIGFCKIFKIFNSCFVVRLSGVFNIFKMAQVNFPRFLSNIRPETILSFFYSFISELPVPPFISKILGHVTKAQITFSIIQAVSVNVVNYLALFCAHYYSVHIESFVFFKLFVPRISRRIKAVLIFCHLPFEFRYSFKRFIINQTNLVLCQLDFIRHSGVCI